MNVNKKEAVACGVPLFLLAIIWTAAIVVSNLGHVGTGICMFFGGGLFCALLCIALDVIITE